MTKEQIFDSLRQLGEELDAQGLCGEMLLTGGAAMCLVHDARDMTKDVDALYEPKPEINQIAAKIAERNGLPADWLNDGVKGFLTPTAAKEDFIALKGLRIQTVSTEYLLAMKLMSSRYGGRDSEDIRFLFRKLGITTFEQASKIVTTYYDVNTILPRVKYVIDSILEEQWSKGKSQLAPKEKKKGLTARIAEARKKVDAQSQEADKTKSRTKDQNER